MGPRKENKIRFNLEKELTSRGKIIQNTDSAGRIDLESSTYSGSPSTVQVRADISAHLLFFPPHH